MPQTTRPLRRSELVALSDAELLLAREVRCSVAGDAVCDLEVMYRQ